MSVCADVLVDACFLPRLLTLAKRPVPPDDIPRFRDHLGLPATDRVPLSTVLNVAERIGYPARHVRVAENTLDHLTPLPCLLVFRDGSTAILDRLAPKTGDSPPALFLRQEGAGHDDAPLVMDWDDLAPLWRGDAVLPVQSALRDGGQSR